MEQKKSLTLNGMTGLNFLFILNAAAMIGVSIYLTTHYYDTLYPTQLGGAGSLCNLSNFFNCDAATYSKISNIAGVPIGFFGIIMGLLFIFSALMPSMAMEKTANALSKYNFIGCIILFIFSIAVLGSLCPFCTLYYVLSGVAFVLLQKGGLNSWLPDFKVAGLWAVVTIIGSFLLFQHTSGKEDKRSKLNDSIVKQFNTMVSVGDPTTESPFKNHMSTATFAEAPIRISIFSDFECPFCKVVAEQIPELIRHYPGKINVQYFFYPLDAKCNSNVKGRFHDNACDAAYLAACDEKKFAEVHDDIFANQAKLKEGVLSELAKKYGETCITNEENKKKVILAVNAATQFNIKSTPTIIVNGKKIEGTIPNAQFFAIFDDILSKK
jgi:protein-disulfide isomerase/uncharacterized membrane protein